MTSFFLISFPTSISGIYWNQSNEDQRSPSLNIFKSVNLSNYEVFINKHTVRKEQKIVKHIERKVATIDRLYQLFIDFPCLVQFKKTDGNATSNVLNIHKYFTWWFNQESFYEVQNRDQYQLFYENFSIYQWIRGKLFSLQMGYFRDLISVLFDEWYNFE